MRAMIANSRQLPVAIENIYVIFVRMPLYRVQYLLILRSEENFNKFTYPHQEYGTV